MTKAEYSKKWYYKNHEKCKQWALSYYHKNAERIKLRTKEYRKSHRQIVRDIDRRKHIKKKFGISVEEYDALFLNQNGKCAICDQPETTRQNGSERFLAVDHDHDTGQIRGLLCFGCNCAIGNFKDSPRILRKALDYVEDKKRLHVPFL